MPTTLRTLTAIAVVSAGVALSTAARAVPIVTNGDFATGDFTGWTLTPTSGNGTLGFAPLPRVDALGANNNPLSGFAAEFNAGQSTTPTSNYEGGTLSQVIALPAGDIHFTAEIGAFNPANATNSYGGKFEVLVNGVVKVSFEFPPLGSLASNTHVLSFDDFVSAGNYTLAIRITTPNLSINSSTDLDLPASARQFLTNVAITVPEPGSIVLLLAGLGGLLLLGARRGTAV